MKIVGSREWDIVYYVIPVIELTRKGFIGFIKDYLFGKKTITNPDKYAGKYLILRRGEIVAHSDDSINWKVISKS